MAERIIIVADWMGSRKRLWRRLWAPISVLAVFIGLLVDVGDAASSITDMIPQALAVFGALFPVLIVAA